MYIVCGSVYQGILSVFRSLYQIYCLCLVNISLGLCSVYGGIWSVFRSVYRGMLSVFRSVYRGILSVFRSVYRGIFAVFRSVYGVYGLCLGLCTGYIVCV